jgi:hypothetical protein
MIKGEPILLHKGFCLNFYKKKMSKYLFLFLFFKISPFFNFKRGLKEEIMLNYGS